jgi:(R,R)-butanediol dehydrogenase / meso-butanediol dehydrogenase / diacetyl reductase
VPASIGRCQTPAMKAAILNTLGQPLVIEERADPAPGPGEVVVKVARCGICGTDLHIAEDPIFRAPPGTVLGHEYAGEVVATGSAVTSIKVGNRVAVLPVQGCWNCVSCAAGESAWCSEKKIVGGGYAEYTVVSERQCLKLPDTITLEDGALVEPLAVGLHGVTLSALKPGNRVLVIGAGPIGLAATFWARQLGAGRIAVTASSNRRADLARTMGASVFVDASDTSAGAINEALGGPPDIVFECVGKPGLIARAVDYVRPRGTVVVLGLCTVPDTIQPFVTMVKEVRIQAAMLYAMRDFEVAADTLDAGAVAPRSMITHRVSLAELPGTFESLRRGRTSECKVMIDPTRR